MEDPAAGAGWKIIRLYANVARRQESLLSIKMDDTDKRIGHEDKTDPRYNRPVFYKFIPLVPSVAGGSLGFQN